MIYDAQTKIHVHILHVLVTGESHTMPRYLLKTLEHSLAIGIRQKWIDLLAFFHWVLVVAKFRLDPVCACSDFEKVFTNASKDQFPNAPIVGYFLLKASNA